MCPVIAEEIMRKVNRGINNLSQSVNKISPEQHASILLLVLLLSFFFISYYTYTHLDYSCTVNFFHLSVHKAFLNVVLDVVFYKLYYTAHLNNRF